MASQRDLDHAYRLRKLHLWQQCVKYFFVSAVLIIVARYMFLSVKELAGRTTTATLITELLLFFRAPRAVALALAWVLTGGAVTYGIRQGQRAKNVIARFHPGQREQQLKVDPKKHSSGITLRGETGVEDL